MRNKNFLILISFFILFCGVLCENIDHFDQGLTQSKSLNVQQPNSMEDILQVLDQGYRKKRTISLSDNSDELYEFFLRQPLPSSIDMESTPPWALQILVQLIKLNQNCVNGRNFAIPRPGRRSADDAMISDLMNSYEERSRPPLSPRLGKKSVPFKPRLGRRSYDD